MRLITYNLRGGGSGKVHWGKIFADFDPDVFLAQESYAPIQHLPPLHYGDRHRHAHWNCVEGLKWGSAIYLKSGFIHTLELPDFQGHVCGIEVDGSVFSVSAGRSLRVFTVHAPDRGGYQRAVNSILDMISANRGDGDLVIGGDFNLTVGERIEGEPRLSSKSDLAILTRLREEFGLVSAWRAGNPALPLPQTLRWGKDKATPYHCDGIFIPQHWKSRLRSCTVISAREWNDLSDHNPVMVDID